MSDWSQISEEEHELNYILDKFQKRKTEKNRNIILQHIKEFKKFNGSTNTQNYTKLAFYKFYDDNNIGAELED